MNIIAFDPGQKGGIAIHYQGITTAHPMPLAGKSLDLPEIATLIRSHSPNLAVIEKVGSMPSQRCQLYFHLWDGVRSNSGASSWLGDTL